MSVSLESVKKVASDGAFGAFFSAIQLISLGHPCERIKTALQTNSNRTSLKLTIANLYQTGGVSEFYKGLRWNIFFQSAKNGFRWITVSRLDHFYSEYIPKDHLLIKQTALAFSQACLETYTFACPLEVLKIRNMTRINSEKVTLKDIASREGVSALYVGSSAFFFKQMASWASYLIAAQKINRLFGKDTNLLQDFVSYSLAGGVNVVLKAPFDTVKVHLQKEGAINKRTIDVFQEIIRTQGFSGLWRGCSISLIHSIWFTGIMFTSMKYLNVYDVSK